MFKRRRRNSVSLELFKSRFFVPGKFMFKVSKRKQQQNPKMLGLKLTGKGKNMHGNNVNALNIFLRFFLLLNFFRETGKISLWWG